MSDEAQAAEAAKQAEADKQAAAQKKAEEAAAKKAQKEQEKAEREAKKRSEGYVDATSIASIKPKPAPATGRRASPKTDPKVYSRGKLATTREVIRALWAYCLDNAEATLTMVPAQRRRDEERNAPSPGQHGLVGQRRQEGRDDTRRRETPRQR